MVNLAQIHVDIRADIHADIGNDIHSYSNTHDRISTWILVSHIHVGIHESFGLRDRTCF